MNRKINFIPLKFLTHSSTNLVPKINQALIKKRNYDTLSFMAMFTAIYCTSIITMYDSDDSDDDDY
uniref:Uncharacterized protein n=1 Tax=Borely moumouvirus TaxID=2712067 RepID=A0A6G6ACG3_9VIRU